jgi:hypothetical protein
MRQSFLSGAAFCFARSMAAAMIILLLSIFWRGWGNCLLFRALDGGGDDHSLTFHFLARVG